MTLQEITETFQKTSPNHYGYARERLPVDWELHIHVRESDGALASWVVHRPTGAKYAKLYDEQPSKEELVAGMLEAVEKFQVRAKP